MMTETQKLMLGVEALRMVYPNFSIGHWNKQEIKEDYLESTKPVLEHAAPTVSEIEGMKIPLTIHESIDRWTAEGNQEREAPYGLVSKQDMIHAILDGDLETIDSSLIGANVALHAIDSELEVPDVDVKMAKDLAESEADLLCEEDESLDFDETCEEEYKRICESQTVHPEVREYIEFNVSNAPKHQYFSKHDKIQFLKLLG